MSVNTLSCQELVELVTDYLEGRLAWVDRARVETHLRTCDGCSTYLEQMRTTIALTGRLREEDIGLDPVMRDRLLDTFREWSRG
jgi:predicted anti-sigma-YlaC factor YlaD